MDAFCLHPVICIPKRYVPAMRVFKKIFKVPFLYLRKLGHASIFYIDDSYLQKDISSECS